MHVPELGHELPMRHDIDADGDKTAKLQFAVLTPGMRGHDEHGGNARVVRARQGVIARLEQRMERVDRRHAH